jgi:hypothetical protein
MQRAKSEGDGATPGCVLLSVTGVPFKRRFPGHTSGRRPHPAFRDHAILRLWTPQNRLSRTLHIAKKNEHCELHIVFTCFVTLLHVPNFRLVLIDWRTARIWHDRHERVYRPKLLAERSFWVAIGDGATPFPIDSGYPVPIAVHLARTTTGWPMCWHIKLHQDDHIPAEFLVLPCHALLWLVRARVGSRARMLSSRV